MIKGTSVSRPGFFLTSQVRIFNEMRSQKSIHDYICLSSPGYHLRSEPGFIIDEQLSQVGWVVQDHVVE